MARTPMIGKGRGVADLKFLLDVACASGFCVEPDRHGAIIDEGDIHVRAEPAMGNFDTERAQNITLVFDESNEIFHLLVFV